MSTNLLTREIAAIEQLAALPVGTVIRDKDGDHWTRERNGGWWSEVLQARMFDPAVSCYLPAVVTNYDELSLADLDGYKLGDLIKVLTADYALAITPGAVCVVERIYGEMLHVRDGNGLVMPLKPDEVAPLEAGPEITVNQRVRLIVNGEIFGVKTGSFGTVIGPQPGALEPTWMVVFDNASPWSSRPTGWPVAARYLEPVSVAKV
ncbi:hypothetical protein FHR83_007080 [Actinoplanes campanulatus]|uniref:Uncharacterized protein n=1 Tax=Actinoplanes campanulatus TaxID=113559 RepID=A0A7W5AP49_9ACTN|nr:hypothetical protein [Actinoplanes campanulatus]MBB3099374.1 hypothetical protein [Actinoplanes campanulatus]GGN40241.1 hypothetical protein GCM10010109_69120 [Actinoplanes campanulatus]GID42417.1 hypothetical protein Aca09nite_89230 [Actinoplanes campanulatus]